MLHKELTYRIIGCAMEVHKIMGCGFQEKIYQRVLSLEMRMQGINFIREYEMNLKYKGHMLGKRRVDFFVENNIMLEIKAVAHLEDVHLAQAMNYLEAYNLPIGLLINFGSKSMQYKRVHNQREV